MNKPALGFFAGEAASGPSWGSKCSNSSSAAPFFSESGSCPWAVWSRIAASLARRALLRLRMQKKATMATMMPTIAMAMARPAIAPVLIPPPPEPEDVGLPVVLVTPAAPVGEDESAEAAIGTRCEGVESKTVCETEKVVFS